MLIEFYIRNIYGKESSFIADPRIAQAVTSLTGRKTINTTDKMALEELGHKLQQVLPMPKGGN